MAANVSSFLDRLIAEKLEPLVCGVGYRRLKSAFRRRSTEGNTQSIYWDFDSDLSTVWLTAGIEFKPLSQTLRHFTGFEHFAKESVPGFGGNWGLLRVGGQWLDWELTSSTFRTVANQMAEVYRSDVEPFLERFVDLRECIAEWTRDFDSTMTATSWGDRYFAIAAAAHLKDWDLATTVGNRVLELARTMASDDNDPASRREPERVRKFLEELATLRARSE